MEIKELLEQYNKRKAEIKKRLSDFKKQEDHFYELCFCILTPQSNAYKCDAAIQVLRGRDFIGRELSLEPILKKYTRFYKNKSRYLLLLKDASEDIFSELNKLKSAYAKREFLAKNVKGLGLKESSHFLRNTGHRGLAILDRHILKNLHSLGVIDEIPQTLTPLKYFEIEQKFQSFAKKIKIPLDELDLLFWSMETGSVFK